MPPGYTLVQLPNGAHGLHSLAYGETMHPGVGPALEAELLYVRQLRLGQRLQRQAGEFVIWDVGLGGAANALAVLRTARDGPGIKVRLLSFDNTTEPLAFALNQAGALGYLENFEAALTELLQRGQTFFANGRGTVEWKLHCADFPDLVQRPEASAWPKPHLILFDPFSPARNPAMWTHPLFRRLHSLLDPERPCLLPTYSRSTMLRVSLLLAGFHVGTGLGVGRKEETTVASNRGEELEVPLSREWLAKARASTNAEPLWEPIYRQAPLAPQTWERLQRHPQFATA